jgi:hypothetical protein
MIIGIWYFKIIIDIWYIKIGTPLHRAEMNKRLNDYEFRVENELHNTSE